MTYVHDVMAMVIQKPVVHASVKLLCTGQASSARPQLQMGIHTVCKASRDDSSTCDSCGNEF